MTNRILFRGFLFLLALVIGCGGAPDPGPRAAPEDAGPTVAKPTVEPSGEKRPDNPVGKGSQAKTTDDPATKSKHTPAEAALLAFRASLSDDSKPSKKLMSSLDLLEQAPGDPVAMTYLEEVFRADAQRVVDLIDDLDPDQFKRFVDALLLFKDGRVAGEIHASVRNAGRGKRLDEELERSLGSEKAVLRAAAALTLATEGATPDPELYFPALLDVLATSNQSGDLETAVREFDRQRWRALTVLERMIGDAKSGAMRRRWATRIAYRFGVEARTLAGALKSAMAETDHRLRIDSALALGNMGDREPDIAPILIGAALDEELDATTRINAVYALQRMGSAAQKHAAALLPLLEEKDAAFADSVLFALLEIGFPKSDAAKLLGRISQLEPGQRAVVLAANFVRERLPIGTVDAMLRDADEQKFSLGLEPYGREAVPTLRRLAADKDASAHARLLAMRMLLDFQPLDAETFQVMSAIADDPFSPMGRMAACVLAHSDEHYKESIPILVQALREGGELTSDIIGAFAVLGQRAGQQADEVAKLLDVKPEQTTDILAAEATLDALANIESPGRFADRAIKALYPAEPQPGAQSWWRILDAASVLGYTRDIATAAAPRLTELLDNEDDKIKFAAVVVLADFGPLAKSKVTVDRLKALIDSATGADRQRLRFWSAIALANIDPPSLSEPKLLVQALRGLPPNDDRRLAAVGVSHLGDRGAALVEPLVAHVVEGGPGAPAAQEALLMLGKHAASATPRLLEHWTRIQDSYAVLAFASQVGPGASAAEPLLLQALESPDTMGLAAEALLAIDKTDDAVTRLRGWLADKQRRHAAAAAVQKLGPRAAAAVPELRKALNGDDDELAALAAQALAAIGAPSAPAVDELVLVLEGENPRAREAAALALGAIGKPAKSASDALKDSLRGTPPCANALEALWKVGCDSKELTPLVILALNSTDSSLQVQAIRVAGKNVEGAEQAGRALAPLLYDSVLSGDVVRAYEKLGSKARSAAPLLITALGKVREPEVQTQVALALAHVGQPPEAKSELQRLAARIDFVRRGRILKALRGLDAKQPR